MKSTDVSEDPAASIIRVDNTGSRILLNISKHIRLHGVTSKKAIIFILISVQINPRHITDSFHSAISKATGGLSSRV
jgi:hypothetical protein